ncbi:MAG TPA: CmcJ/NvfI family oxidoreductase [Steroidobacteraceae bacterium]
MDTRAMIAYSGRAVSRPRYHANDHSRDVLDTTLIEMDVMDARARAPTLDDAGFTLIAHHSAVGDFADHAAIEARHRPEIIALVQQLSGADMVLINSPGILRFSERSPQSGVLDNSRPARFAHVDVSDATAAVFAQRAAPPGRSLARFVHRDEALIFKTHDSDRSRAHCVPHVAFDHAACPAHAVPRVSIEMRALALWFA